MNSLIVGSSLIDLGPEPQVKITSDIGDVRDLDARGGERTLTINIPGTKANRTAFTHIYELDNAIRNDTVTNFNPDFNPNIRASCRLLQDEIEQISGYLRLLKITIDDKDEINFECQIVGEFPNFARELGQHRLNELDFTEFNHILTYTHVSESWDTQIQKFSSGYVNFSGGLPTGEGYVYALIDDGSFSNYYGDTNVSQFYPALYVKQIVDKVFSFAGYSYTSDSFFNSQYFKQLIVPCPTGMQLGAEDMLDKEFEATKSSGQVIVGGNKITFPVENFDTGGNYDTGTSEYTSPVSGALNNFYLDSKATITGLTPSTAFNVYYTLMVNGLPRAFAHRSILSNGSGGASMDSLIILGVTLQTGDDVTIEFTEIRDIATNTVQAGYTYTQSATSLWYNKLLAISWGLNGSVDFSNFFNEEGTMADFMRSIFLAFNLQIEKVTQKTLFVQTRDEFYDGVTEDWSALLDNSRPFEIIPMGELDANPYIFTYSKGEDAENKDYQSMFTKKMRKGNDQYERVYGDKIYEVDNDFIDKEKKIELIFAPTQLLKADGYDKVLSYVPLEMDKGTGQLRLLYYGGLKTCSSYLIYNNSNMTGSSNARTNYPLTLHIDDPDAPTEDLCFGMPLRINLPKGTTYTNNNLFNKYYSRYITEITDKNSDLVRGYFYIDPARWNQISFRKIYFFEGNYFYLNKISNYDPESVETTLCEFLKIEQAVSFTPGEVVIGSGDVVDGEGIDGGGGPDIVSVGMILGRDNSGGEEQLFIGDGIVSGLGARVNAILGSQNVTLKPYAQRAVMIGCENISADTDELWIQNQQFDLSGASSGKAIVHNGTEFVPQNIAAQYEYHDISVSGPLGPDISGRHIYAFAADGGALTNTLPTPAAGQKCIITCKKMDSTGNSVTIDTQGSETIDGAGSKILAAQYNVFTLAWDETNTRWLVI